MDSGFDLEKAALAKEASKPRFSIGIRHMQYLLFCSAVAIVYSIRTTLSVAIIEMTDKNPKNPKIPTYPDWEPYEDIILSSFFWGYVVTQVGAGELAVRFGPWIVLLVSMTLNAVLNGLMPVVANEMGYIGAMVLRCSQGLSQGVIYPSLQNLLSKWAPMRERATACSIVYGSSSFGVLAAMLITGAVCDSDWGWIGVFYLYAAIGMAWAVVWWFLGANTPAEHKWISDEEINFIAEGCRGNSTEVKTVPTPWKKIFVSVPVLAIFATNFGQLWGTFTLLTEIPTFMSSIMKFDIKNNSQLSTLPYLAQWILGLVFSPCIDFIINRGYLRLATVRKMCSGLASFVPGAALLALGFVNESQKNLTISLLVVAVAFAVCAHSGAGANSIDISPNHAGVIMGITNGLSNIASILGPLSVSMFGGDKKDPIVWRNVFWLASGFYFATGVIFVIFASADLQPWNDATEDITSSNNDKKSDIEKVKY